MLKLTVNIDALSVFLTVTFELFFRPFPNNFLIYFNSFQYSVVVADSAYKYMFKVNNRNAAERCEISSKLTIRTAGRRCFSRVFVVNFERRFL